jgi:hypothetical protein
MMGGSPPQRSPPPGWGFESSQTYLGSNFREPGVPLNLLPAYAYYELYDCFEEGLLSGLPPIPDHLVPALEIALYYLPRVRLPGLGTDLVHEAHFLQLIEYAARKGVSLEPFPNGVELGRICQPVCTRSIERRSRAR